MNAPLNPEQIPIPDITLSGETVSYMLSILNNPILFGKSPDGTMRPFADALPLLAVIQTAIARVLEEKKKEFEAQQKESGG